MVENFLIVKKKATFIDSKTNLKASMKLSCVIVDDSSIQRMIVNKLVTNHQNLKLVGRNLSNAGLKPKIFCPIILEDLLF